MDLSDLESVDWSSLQHAYGSAEDIPGLIHSLVSSDPKVRKQAIYAAFGNIWHQGTIYEATVEAVPFLVRIAVTAGVPDRGRVIELLAAIAVGTGYVSVHRSLMSSVDGSDELDAHEAEERLHIEAIGRALAQAVPDLVMLLDDPDADVRSAVCWLLGRIPARADDVRPSLLERYSHEPDDLCRAAELLSLGALAQGGLTASLAEVLASGAVAGGATAVAAAMVRAVVATDDDERTVACRDFISALDNGGGAISQLAVVGEADGPVAFMAAIVGPQPGVQAVLEAGLLGPMTRPSARPPSTWPPSAPSSLGRRPPRALPFSQRRPRIRTENCAAGPSTRCASSTQRAPRQPRSSLPTWATHMSKGRAPSRRPSWETEGRTRSLLLRRGRQIRPHGSAKHFKRSVRASNCPSTTSSSSSTGCGVSRIGRLG